MALTASPWDLPSCDVRPAMAQQLSPVTTSRVGGHDATTALEMSFDQSLSLDETSAATTLGEHARHGITSRLSPPDRRSSDGTSLPTQHELCDQEDDLFRAGGAMDLDLMPAAPAHAPATMQSAASTGADFPTREVISRGPSLPQSSSTDGRAAPGHSTAESVDAAAIAAQEAILSGTLQQHQPRQLQLQQQQQQQQPPQPSGGQTAAPILATNSAFAVGPSIGDLPADATPSRMLFVRNLNPTTAAAELQRAFEAFGDVRTMYTACIGRGFCMISYYDLRAACLAIHSLQGTLLAGSQLDVHFSSPREDGVDHSEGDVTLYNLDPATTVKQLYESFVSFGDVKNIVNAPPRGSGAISIIHFYDVRHAAAAYQALSKGASGGQSKRHPQFFDMASLPSVPEVNVQSLPNHGSNASLGGTSGAGENRDSSTLVGRTSSRAIPMEQNDSLSRLYSSMSTLGAHSCGSLSAQGDIDSTWRRSLGPIGSPPGNLKGGDMDGMRGQLPPQTRLSASNSQDHLQRLSSSGALPGTTPMLTGGHSGAFAVTRPAGSISASPRATIGGNPISDAFHSGSYGACGSFGAAPTGSSIFSAQSIDSRLGSLDMALMGSRPAAPTSASTSGAQRMHLVNEFAPIGRQMSSGGISGASARDLTALYEAQQAQLASQHEQLVEQQRMLRALQSASSLNSSRQKLGISNNSFSPGTSPSQAGWMHLHAQQQHQQQQQQQQQEQAQHAAMLGSSSTGRMSAMQLQALLVAQAAGSGGGQQQMAMPRSRSASAMMQHDADGMYGSGSTLSGQGPSGQHNSHFLGSRRSEDTQGGGAFSNRMSRRQSVGQAAGVPALERRNAQDRLYSLDLDRVLAGKDGRTTLMIKNIPNKYTQKMLLATIDELFRGTYDFFYLPIDFKNRCNVGYAFINLLQPRHVVPLVDRFNNRKWEKFNSEKICHITYARIQGKNAMVAHFQNSSLLHEDKRCRPVLFHSDGAFAGEAEPFPVGPAMRPRPARAPARDTHRENKLRERDGLPW